MNLGRNDGDIVIVMAGLNAKVGNDNDGLKLDERNDNGERFVDFCNANRLIIGGTTFEDKACYKFSW